MMESFVKRQIDCHWMSERELITIRATTFIRLITLQTACNVALSLCMLTLWISLTVVHAICGKCLHCIFNDFFSGVLWRNIFFLDFFSPNICSSLLRWPSHVKFWEVRSFESLKLIPRSVIRKVNFSKRWWIVKENATFYIKGHFALVDPHVMLNYICKTQKTMLLNYNSLVYGLNVFLALLCTD